MGDTQIVADQTKQALIFIYGTLKRDHPNHHLIHNLICQNDAVYLGTYITHNQYPLVIGPNGIPFLINIPGEGHRVKGELYSISTRGLPIIDELEGTSRGHYDRLPIQVIEVKSEGSEGKDGALVEVEVYFANPSFGEKLWEKKGRVGLSQYSLEDADRYVKVENRPKDSNFLDEVVKLILS